jgi:hypothetical protein
MIQIRAKLKVPRSAYKLEVKGKLLFEQHGDHFHARLDSGEEVEVRLTRGEVLRAGDLVTASDGRVLEVVTQQPVEIQHGHDHGHHHDHDHDH